MALNESSFNIQISVRCSEYKGEVDVTVQFSDGTRYVSTFYEPERLTAAFRAESIIAAQPQNYCITDPSFVVVASTNVDACKHVVHELLGRNLFHRFFEACESH